MQPSNSSNQIPSKVSYNLKLVSKAGFAELNKNNSHAYSPCMTQLQGPILIHKPWFEQLSQSAQESFSLQFTDQTQYQFVDLQFPHQVIKCSQYWKFYTWYVCKLYDFGNYLDELRNCNNQEQICMVKFQGEEQRLAFRTLFFKNEPDYEAKVPRLVKEIQSVLDQHKQQQKSGWFVKLSQRSAKNQMKLYPCFTVKDVFANLIYSQDVMKQIEESSGILLRPWVDFSNGVEFRVLIYCRRLVGISQQFIHNKIKWKNVNFGRFIEMLQDKIQCLKFANSFVADVVYIDENNCHILELNPYGVYSASRSALFSHEQILSLQKQPSEIVIKVLT